MYPTNPRVIEITRGFVGYIGYRKLVVLFSRGTRCNIWIEGKKVYTCELLREPTGRGRPAREVHISKVSDGGDLLFMLDGSIYEVDPIDRIHTSLWLGISDGLLINGLELLNFDEGELVNVTRIR